MSSSRKTILAIAGFAVFLILAVTAYNSLTGAYAKANAANGTTLRTAAPRTAPDFTVYDAEGKPVRLVDFAGKPVVLNFWASWCPPCKAEMPYFDKVYREMKDDVVFIMLDVVDGTRETKELGLAYVKEQGFAFSPYFDLKQQAANKYSITAIPATYFINASGEIVHSVRGSIEEKALRAGISLIRK